MNSRSTNESALPKSKSRPKPRLLGWPARPVKAYWQLSAVAVEATVVVGGLLVDVAWVYKM